MHEREQGEPAPSAPLGQLWTALQGAIRKRVEPEQFETWFRRAALSRVDEQAVHLVVQNAFSRDWLNANYKDVIEQAVRTTMGPHRVEVEVDPELTVPDAAVDPLLIANKGQLAVAGSTSASASAASSSSTPSSSPSSSPSNGVSVNGKSSSNGASFAASDRPRTPGQKSGRSNGHQRSPSTPTPIGSALGHTGLLRNSDFGLNDKYTFDNFVVGPCNRFAHAAAVGVSESPGQAYNPFFLHGNVGLGKTHLLQSACFSLLERDPKCRILFLSCETFVNHFISALENGDLQKFRDKYRNIDVLVVDDIHVLANKVRTQEEFFHTFNSLYNAGKQIVLSSDSPPKDIPTLQERLVSRFKWGLVTEIEPPCYETRMAILKRKSRERGREIPDDVASLLAERIESNIRELEGAVTKLIGYASLSKQPVTRELVREVMKDLFVTRRGQPSMEDILKVVTEYFGVKLTELQSRKRTNAIAHPRQVAMFLARRITRHSLEEIGGYFGGRDHSTVLYAVSKVQKRSKEDEAFRGLLADLLGQLETPARDLL
jgi:chromosomal replication initiator protein